MNILLRNRRTDPAQNEPDASKPPLLITGVECVTTVYMDIVRVRFIDDELTTATQKMTGWDAWDTHTLQMRRHEEFIQVDHPVDGAMFFSDYDIAESFADCHLPLVKWHVVIVGNLGPVYCGYDYQQACDDFNFFVSESLRNEGRSAGENVFWTVGGSPHKELICRQTSKP